MDFHYVQYQSTKKVNGSALEFRPYSPMYVCGDEKGRRVTGRQSSAEKTAVRKKLFLSLVVLVWRFMLHLPEGKGGSLS